MAELTPDQSPAPWVPISDPQDLKVLGKFVEEASEGAKAAARCIIQGLDEADPVTGKINRRSLEEEIADIEANIELAKRLLSLDRDFIDARRLRKLGFLSTWLTMLAPAVRTPYAGRCREGDRCVCGGDTPGVRASCGNWVKARGGGSERG